VLGGSEDNEPRDVPCRQSSAEGTPAKCQRKRAECSRSPLPVQHPVMLGFHNTLGVIFGAGMNTVRSSGFSRSSTRRGNFQRSRLKAELLTVSQFSFVFISSEAKHLWIFFAVPLTNTTRDSSPATAGSE
jgi:hypothetical protein